MIRVSEIEQLYNLVAFRQSTLDGYDILSTANTASLTGLYVNDLSGLITTKNIKDSQEDNAITDNEFNTYLTNLRKAAMVRLCNAVFSERDLIENRVLYPYEYDRTHTLENDTSFVGYEIDTAKTKDVNVRINSLILDWTTSESVTIYLFNSAKDAAHQTQAITTTEKGTKEQSVEWDLPFSNSLNGGKWYVGYYRSGLSGQAYDREFERANIRTDYNMLGIRPIKVPGWDTTTLFDVNDIDEASETWGMNFDISAYRDYTSIVVENKDRFAEGLRLQTAYDIMNMMSSSTRSNRNERIMRSEVDYELFGNSQNPDVPNRKGIAQQLRAEIKSLKETFFKPPKVQINTIRG